MLHCKSGARWAEALAIVKNAGFTDAVHVGGGVAVVGQPGSIPRSRLTGACPGALQKKKGGGGGEKKKKKKKKKKGATGSRSCSTLRRAHPTYEVNATRAGRRVEIARAGGRRGERGDQDGYAVSTAGSWRAGSSRWWSTPRTPRRWVGPAASMPGGPSPPGDPARRRGDRGTAIAELQRLPGPAPGPEAELWMGAHPSAPSGIDEAGSDAGRGDRRRSPAARSGECVARFGRRLPFLLKVLSAKKALSIQVHPSRAQARAGCAAETSGDSRRATRPGTNATTCPNRSPVRADRFEVWPACAPRRTPPRLRALAVAQLSRSRPDWPAAAAGTAMADALGSVLGGQPAALVAAVRRRGRGAGRRGPRPNADACAADRAGSPGPRRTPAGRALLIRYEVLQPGEAVFMPAAGARLPAGHRHRTACQFKRPCQGRAHSASTSMCLNC